MVTDYNAKDPVTGKQLVLPQTTETPIRHSLKRGALESYSSFKPISVKGDRLTVLEVPYHRVMMTYLLSKSANKADNFFMSDSENEFVAMTDGIDADYHGRGYT